MNRILISALAAIVASASIACSPSSRPAPASAVAAPAQPPPPDSPPIVSYERSIDPLARAFDGEQNAFYSRAIARMWLASAMSEEVAGHPRISAADAAFKSAESKHPQGCELPQLEVAISRVDEQKSSLERRYLEMLDRMGEDHRESRSLDAQIHALRDELGELENQALPCRRRALSPKGAK